MTTTKQILLCTLLALLLLPAVVVSQEVPAPARGVIEFGVRGVTGEVYGRSNPGDVLMNFRPDVEHSSLNTYSDYRNGLYLPKFNVTMDNFLGTKSYFDLQSASSGVAFQDGRNMSRDQSFLATFGHYSLYKVQFRFDETPHLFTGTTSTLFGGGNGRWALNPNLQKAMYACVSATAGCPITDAQAAAFGISGFSGLGANNTNRTYATIASAVAGQMGFAGPQAFAQEETRKTLSGLASWNITPNWNAAFSLSREHQLGTRPIGMVMGTGSSAFWVEVPESIDYDTTNIKVSSEFGKKSWSGLLGFQSSIFNNNVPSMLVDNPFSTIFSSTYGPPLSQMSSYPDNKYNQFITAGTLDAGRHVHLMAYITPGVLTQNAAFIPTTTNPSTTGSFVSFAEAPGHLNLPQSTLDGHVNTLAMNYTAVFTPVKPVQVVARYMHYDYDNSTPELEVRAFVSDVGTASCNTYAGKGGYCDTEQSSFTRDTFDLSGTVNFFKKNSAKVGFQREWMSRTNRHVGESIENALYASTDLNLRKDLVLRISGRHQLRMPQDYDTSLGYTLHAPTDYYYLRMYDQAARARSRGDVSLTWNATDKLSLSAFWGTLQDNYNLRDSINSLTSLGDLSHTPGINTTTAPTVKFPKAYGPYYAYGLLNNVGRNFGGDINYAVHKDVVVFAQYIRENNTSVIMGGAQKNTSGCVPNASGFYTSNSCDPINDVVTWGRDVADTYLGGADFSVTKKLDLSVYYSLSATKSRLDADGVNCQIGVGPNSACRTNFVNWSLESNYIWVTMGYPENVNRIHEVGAIARFKLTKNIMPKFQYMYQQNDYKDWQTSPMNNLSFVPAGIGSPYSSTIGNPSMAKMLFLGADTPSYRAHVFSATVEYHF